VRLTIKIEHASGDTASIARGISKAELEASALTPREMVRKNLLQMVDQLIEGTILLSDEK